MQESCQILVDVRGDEGAYNVPYDDTYNDTLRITYIHQYSAIMHL